MDPTVEARIVEMRRAHPGWGPRTVVFWLDREGVAPLPGRTSVERCLVRHGLVTPRARRRKHSDYKRWERARAMELWQMGVVGGVRLVDGSEAKVVSGIDDRSRFVVCVQVVARATARPVCDALEAAMGRGIGGRFSVSFPLEEHIVVGNRSMPPRLTTGLDYPDDHSAEVDVTIDDDGTSVVESVRVQRHPGRPSLRGAELRTLPIDELIDWAIAEVAIRTDVAPLSDEVAASSGGLTLDIGQGPRPVGADFEYAFERFCKRRRRNVVTDALLRDVAREYRRGIEMGAPARAVAEVFDVSARTAHRYIALARERGFLEPRETTDNKDRRD